MLYLSEGQGLPRRAAQLASPIAAANATLGVDWICGLPVTAAGFNQLMVIVDLLSGKVHATPSKSTDNAAMAAQTLLDHSLRSGDGVPDVLVVDHDLKFTSQLFHEFT